MVFTSQYRQWTYVCINKEGQTKPKETYSNIDLHSFFFFLWISILFVEVTSLLCFLLDVIFSFSLFCRFIWDIRRQLYLGFCLLNFNIVLIGIQNYYSIAFLFEKRVTHTHTNKKCEKGDLMLENALLLLYCSLELFYLFQQLHTTSFIEGFLRIFCHYRDIDVWICICACTYAHTHQHQKSCLFYL